MGSYRPSFTGINEMLRADFIADDLRARAEKVMARAIATAPYDVNDRDGRHYKDAFHVEVVTEPTGHGRWGDEPRAIAKVYNDDMPTALFVEYGVVGGKPAPPGHRTLGKALDSAAD